MQESLGISVVDKESKSFERTETPDGKYKYPFRRIDESGKRVVWNKGIKISQNGVSLDPNEWRRDVYGYAMQYSKHGNTDSEFGWEIDHIKPLSKGGSNFLGNLRPLNWKVNRAKGENFPWNYYKVD